MFTTRYDLDIFLNISLRFDVTGLLLSYLIYLYYVRYEIVTEVTLGFRYYFLGGNALLLKKLYPFNNLPAETVKCLINKNYGTLSLMSIENSTY